jgi:hypothetical protein
MSETGNGPTTTLHARIPVKAAVSAEINVASWEGSYAAKKETDAQLCMLPVK